MNCFWEKFLIDGTTEVGTDEDIDKGLASWTRGKQDICKCILSFENLLLDVTIPQPSTIIPWKQKDHFVAVLGTNSDRSPFKTEGFRIARSLVVPVHKCNSYEISKSGSTVVVTLGRKLPIKIFPSTQFLEFVLNQNNLYSVFIH